MHEFAVFFAKRKSKIYTATADADFSYIQSEKEIDVLKKLGEFPEAVGEAALKRMPHRITNYIYELASTFHSFYNAEKVLRSRAS